MTLPANSVISDALKTAMLVRPACMAVDGPALAALCDALSVVIRGTILLATVAPGIPVTTAGSATTQTGATTGPGALT